MSRRKPRASLSADQAAAAREMHRSGLGWNELGRLFEVDPDTVRRALDLEWANRRREQINAVRRGRRIEDARQVISSGRPTHEEYRAAVRRIPPDTRDLTGRLCGDPLPGRRAIDGVRP